MKLSAALILVLSLTTLTVAAHADGKYTCTNAQAGQFVETVTVTGLGQQATVHIEDPSFSGDFTYNAQYTAVLAKGPYTGDWVIVGTITDNVSNPPSASQGAFIVEPSLLNGADGKLFRFAGESFLEFDCKQGS